MCPPPRSTLFPHTTLDRSEQVVALLQPPHHAAHVLLDRVRDQIRSEEHTSELQSRRDLVCRLLLEKKKAPPTRSAAATTIGLIRVRSRVRCAAPIKVTSME